jgi:hypothetical protein
MLLNAFAIFYMEYLSVGPRLDVYTMEYLPLCPRLDVYTME